MQKIPYCRLGVNIDHVATIRNARGGAEPSPVNAALIAQAAGADGITAHLREDRRHIRDHDMVRLKNEIDVPLNFEMAATDEMVEICINTKPHAACLVPEKREEKTTEGGLDLIGLHNQIAPQIEKLKAANIRVSLFIDPEIDQINMAKTLNVPVIELHTGKYHEVYENARRHKIDPFTDEKVLHEIDVIQKAAEHAHGLGIETHAGHGLTLDNVAPIAAIPELKELNIGHALIADSIFMGLENAIKSMRLKIYESRFLG